MTTPVTEQEGRRIQRISLPLPSRIDVRVDKNLAWNEMTRLTDVSTFGAGFLLRRPLKRGRLILLTIPMPRQLRCFDFTEDQYKVWALVRRCIPTTSNGEERFMVGAAFIGKKPPQSYLDNPSYLYDISHREDKGMWSIHQVTGTADESGLPIEAKRQTRFSIPETLELEWMDENGNISASETTVTENISLGGAAVFTSMDAHPGAIMRVTSRQKDITIISVVRARRKGPDGMIRLHLEFIDRFFPLTGLE